MNKIFLIGLCISLVLLNGCTNYVCGNIKDKYQCGYSQGQYDTIEYYKQNNEYPSQSWTWSRLYELRDRPEYYRTNYSKLYSEEIGGNVW